MYGTPVRGGRFRATTWDSSLSSSGWIETAREYLSGLVLAVVLVQGRHPVQHGPRAGRLQLRGGALEGVLQDVDDGKLGAQAEVVGLPHAVRPHVGRAEGELARVTVGRHAQREPPVPCRSLRGIVREVAVDVAVDSMRSSGCSGAVLGIQRAG